MNIFHFVFFLLHKFPCYTDNTIDEEGNTKVYASIYNPDQDETKLLPIETEKEWKIIETILDELQNETVSNEQEG